MQLREELRRAADAAWESFVRSKESQGVVTTKQSGDDQTTTKTLRTSAGDAAFLRIHVDCLKEIARIEEAEKHANENRR